MSNPVIYLRREPTDDEEVLSHPTQWDRPEGYFDVVAYHDINATQFAWRYPWHYSNNPTRRNDRVSMNYCTYDVCWLPDAPLETQEAQV